MIGKSLQQIIRKTFGGLHVITLINVYQIAPVNDQYISKDHVRDYGQVIFIYIH